MEINGMGVNNYSSYKAQSLKEELTHKVTVKSADGKTEETAAVQKTDTFVKSESAQSVTYSAPKKLSSSQVEDIKKQSAENLKNLVSQMLGKQAGKAAGSSDMAGMLGLKNADKTEKTAAEALYDDDTWGVDAVATRIMDFAVTLSGGDTSKIAELRDAVERGFKAAGVELGSDLPGICQDTRKEIMNRFDYWEENGSLDGYKMSDAD